MFAPTPMTASAGSPARGDIRCNSSCCVSRSSTPAPSSADWTGTWAVAIAALAGKPAGVLAAVAVAVALGLHLPHRVGWRELTVVAFATSIGFTFALFFATAAIPVGPILVEAKLGALLTVCGSLIATAAAFVLGVGRFAKGRGAGSVRGAGLDTAFGSTVDIA